MSKDQTQSKDIKPAKPSPNPGTPTKRSLKPVKPAKPSPSSGTPYKFSKKTSRRKSDAS